MVKNRKSRDGSLSVMASVFAENESMLRKYLRRFSSNPHDIEDITQETILRALNAEKRTSIQEPRAFLFGIARNVARKGLEKKSKSIIDYIEDFAPREYVSDVPSVSDAYESRERMMLFAEAVATLPEQCQKVFVLKKVYGYSHKEISKKLAISISTTEKHVATGLKRCIEYMEKIDREDNLSESVTVLRGKK